MHIYQLECGHYGKHPRRVNEAICDECGTWQNVEEMWPLQWWTACSRSGCWYKRKAHGVARVNADKAAQRHRDETGHRVTVRYYSNAPAEARNVTKRSQQEPLPFDPPF